MEGKEIKLNLLCGEDVKVGWLNYDFFPCDNRVFYFNALEFPYPFLRKYADKILISNGLEHFYKEMQIKIVNECYKILKDGGELILRLPTFLPYISHKTGFHHDNYLSGFVCKTPITKYLEQETFKEITVKGLRSRKWGWRFKKMLFSYFYDEYEYILKK